MKGLFFNVPTSGHVNASLPLTAELVRRGEEIVYYLTDSYRQKVEATGATFREYNALVASDYFEQRQLDGSNPPSTARNLMDTTQQLLPTLIEITEREKPDYIIYDTMCPWGAMVARICKLPAISSMALLVITPAMLMQPSNLVQMVPVLLRGIPNLRRYLAVSAEIGRQYNVKALTMEEAFGAPADLTLCYTSQAFQPDGDKLAGKVKFVGPSIEPRPVDNSFPFDKLDSSKPLIYISLGTVINENPDFFKACIAAFDGQPYQVVMAIGHRIAPESLGKLPANFIVQAYVPQLQLLERAALFITHAGMNSVHEGLYYNVPLLLVPQQYEQDITALRAARLGTGIKLDKAQATPERLRADAIRILSDSSFKANATRIGKSLRDAGGHKRAVDEIFKLVGRS